jgi:integrase
VPPFDNGCWRTSRSAIILRLRSGYTSTPLGSFPSTSANHPINRVPRTFAAVVPDRGKEGVDTHLRDDDLRTALLLHPYSAPEGRHRAMPAILYGSGLRVSEVTGIKVADVDTARNVLWVRFGKGRKDRQALLPPMLRELLRCYWRSRHPHGCRTARTSVRVLGRCAPSGPRRLPVAERLCICLRGDIGDSFPTRALGGSGAPVLRVPDVPDCRRGWAAADLYRDHGAARSEGYYRGFLRLMTAIRPASARWWSGRSASLISADAHEHVRSRGVEPDVHGEQ